MGNKQFTEHNSKRFEEVMHTTVGNAMGIDTTTDNKELSLEELQRRVEARGAKLHPDYGGYIIIVNPVPEE